MIIVYILGGLILIIIISNIAHSFFEKRKKQKFEARKKKERWGEITNLSISGESWQISRRMLGCVNGKLPDSVPYLTSLGFKLLGYVNEMEIFVEPPAGWTKSWTGDYYEILDESGTSRFVDYISYLGDFVRNVIQPRQTKN
jgi:hypothetical protein